MARLRVLIVCGGPSSEYEVSLNTANMILRGLDRKKYDPYLATIKKNGLWQFAAARNAQGKTLSFGEAVHHIQHAKFDFAFIAMHGAFGEDGRMQALLEWIGLPYAGSGVLASAMAMDKEVSNILYAINGLKVPQYAVLKKAGAGSPRTSSSSIPLPVVVKPVNGGSSVGVSIVKTRGELSRAIKSAFKEDSRVMIQKYIKGREFTCGILEGRNGKAFALPPTEIIPQISGFFDYQAKYKVGGSLEVTPPKLPKTKIKAMQKMALTAHHALGCRGMSRTDFILDGSRFYILETNTIPGMTATSLLPQAAKVAGIPFPAFLELMINRK
jgi:D-alanine-D-alanine ligase